ncbi:Signal transducer regulating beta-lactamase production, contains metallopeptidase domain [Desulfonispora thiosulfatigenes DSM 11270]|uniref:Signal transducer regulating beta-lactamase production, contains metallopeptidase domain n=1 Tax=Desulfonispora thiosulfatigenes DSM 11270 TaxID=656914 RepID=A0A1W1UXD2_DESTI|nr:M56 family metallopeptidase [Desulfonispora thiosulfatigenes]SMB85808.1 Signal transducer regulating beta-lactamase production, contains metallopeptidase domain [Desulfonispora thiosulfatigenes DSM 11270]
MINLFIEILNMSILASFVALVVMVLRIVLKRAPKIISYSLWIVVLFRLVCPFSLENSFSLNLFSSEVIKPEIMYTQNPEINSNVGIIDETINQSLNNSLPPVNPAASVNPMGIIMEVSTKIWVIGIIIMLCYGIFTYLRVKNKVKFATLVEDNIFASDQIKTPFILGLIKPKIYLPLGIDSNEQDFILKHEQIHLKRLDHLIKPIAFLVLTIHWFNPLIWLSFILMSKDMEMSCDESVLKSSNEDIRKNYASSLLSFSVKKSGILSPLSFGESNVKSRIKNILNYEKPSFWILMVTVILVVIIGIGLLSDAPVGKEDETVTVTKAGDFLKYKTKYVGNNSKVGNIISLLEFPDDIKYDSFKLQTTKPPYGVTINFNTDANTCEDYAKGKNHYLIQKNALIMFSLIENVDIVGFELRSEEHTHKHTIHYDRIIAEKIMGRDLRHFAQSEKEFADFLKKVKDLKTLDNTNSFVGGVDNPGQEKSN